MIEIKNISNTRSTKTNLELASMYYHLLKGKTFKNQEEFLKSFSVKAKIIYSEPKNIIEAIKALNNKPHNRIGVLATKRGSILVEYKLNKVNK